MRRFKKLVFIIVLFVFFSGGRVSDPPPFLFYEDENVKIWHSSGITKELMESVESRIANHPDSLSIKNSDFRKDYMKIISEQ
jgi:hypothetical protein